jgi:hypothetical protein
VRNEAQGKYEAAKEAYNELHHALTISQDEYFPPDTSKPNYGSFDVSPVRPQPRVLDTKAPESTKATTPEIARNPVTVPFNESYPTFLVEDVSKAIPVPGPTALKPRKLRLQTFGEQKVQNPYSRIPSLGSLAAS